MYLLKCLLMNCLNIGIDVVFFLYAISFALCYGSSSAIEYAFSEAIGIFFFTWELSLVLFSACSYLGLFSDTGFLGLVT